MSLIETQPSPRPHPLGALLTFGAITAAAAALGGAATAKSVRSPWYWRLKKPRFQPPPAAFGPAWTILYGLMTASAWRVWRAPSSPERTRALAWWGTQISLNAAWTWIFFGARKPAAALVELSALLGAIVLYANEARKVDRAAAWLVAPYIGWTGFAGVLNEEIVRRIA
jgi:tryptophan-rich sensory protein